MAGALSWGLSPPANPPPVERLPSYVLHDPEKRRRLEAMVQANFPSGLTVTDAQSPDHPIIYVNRLFEFCTGYDAMEVLGKNCRFLQYRGAYATDRHPLVDREVVAELARAVAEGREFRGQLLNFRKDGFPLLNDIFITPVHGDPQRPTVVTYFVAIQRFRPANISLGPLPRKPAGWLPDNLAGEREPIPTPITWSTGGTDRDEREWLNDIGDRELCHLFGFLNLKGLAAMAATSRRMRRLVDTDSVWHTVCERLWGVQTTHALESHAAHLGWKRIAREIYTLEALSWRRRRVGGQVTPSRTNFSTCAVGNNVYIFGGEGADMAAYSDLFVLDCSEASPSWRRMPVADSNPQPAGRWGHTLRELGPSHLVLFGGCTPDGPLNDLFTLDLARVPPTWRALPYNPSPSPQPRSWHGACTVNGQDLIIFGGCSAAGRLLSDTWRINLTEPSPHWEELSAGWAPPARLGLSLVATEGSRIFAFGGLASAGPVRLRSQDAFTMDLSSRNPTWSYVSGSQLPSGASAAGTPPPPRLEQVVGTIIGGRVLVFGGSVNGGASGSASWEPYVMSPNSEHPTWRRLHVRGEGPRDAWGYSASMLNNKSFILAGRFDGTALDLNEINELCLLTDPHSVPARPAFIGPVPPPWALQPAARHQLLLEQPEQERGDAAEPAAEAEAAGAAPAGEAAAAAGAAPAGAAAAEASPAISGGGSLGSRGPSHSAAALSMMRPGLAQRADNMDVRTIDMLADDEEDTSASEEVAGGAVEVSSMRDIASKPLGRFIVTAPLGGVPVPRAVAAELATRALRLPVPEAEQPPPLQQQPQQHGGGGVSGPQTASRSAEHARARDRMQSEGTTADAQRRSGAERPPRDSQTAAQSQLPQSAWAQPFAAAAAQAAAAAAAQAATEAAAAVQAGVSLDTLMASAPPPEPQSRDHGPHGRPSFRRHRLAGAPPGDSSGEASVQEAEQQQASEPPLCADFGEDDEQPSPHLPMFRRSMSAGREGRAAQTAQMAQRGAPFQVSNHSRQPVLSAFIDDAAPMPPERRATDPDWGRVQHDKRRRDSSSGGSSDSGNSQQQG